MAHIIGHADEPEPNTIAWSKWKNAQDPQDPEAYQQAVAEWKATVFEELSTGKAHPRVTRRIDFDKHRGAFTSQRRTRDPLHCKKPTLVAYSQPHCRIDETHRLAHAACRGARPRGSRAQRSSASRARSSTGDSDSSEPGPGPRWPGDESFTHEEAVDAARHVVTVCGGSLTPARFDIVDSPCLFGLEGEKLAHAKLLVFLELPDELQRSFYNAIRVGHATWMTSSSAGGDDRQLGFDQAGGVA